MTSTEYAERVAKIKEIALQLGALSMQVHAESDSLGESPESRLRVAFNALVRTIDDASSVAERLAEDGELIRY